MSEKERLNTAVESMGVISNRLKELSNLINTAHSGLMSEGIEEQALDCIMCFLHTVNELHTYTGQALKEVTREGNPNEA